jgi:hypothetical protein
MKRGLKDYEDPGSLFNEPLRLDEKKIERR